MRRDETADRDRALSLPTRSHAAHAVGRGSISCNSRAPALVGRACRALPSNQHIKRILDVTHVVGEGAGGQPQLLGGGRKAAGLGGHLQHGERIRVQDIACVLHADAGLVQFI